MPGQAASNKSLEDWYWQLLECVDSAAREQLLVELRGTDPQMAGELEKMLEAHESAGAFLEPRQSREPELTDRLAATLDSQPAVNGATLKVPEMIGPYKLLEPIGEGGMGLVYLAQQSQPVRRKVAIKIIKPGMDSRQVIARFEAERQALAMMEHPNIAKVLDAGTTDAGLPYFVMELVRGIPITQYCDRARMGMFERLNLFRDACSAIQHAHNKGIIHRDIKPSNVLVTEHDGTPVVKVIDFGVAKALTDNLTDKTLYTGMFQMLGTPLYMSPEQASLSNLDVDVRSDVYSLGVLLYELISGTLPIDRECVRSMSFDQLRQHICETEPVRPSRRVSTLRDQGETIAERGGLNRQQLVKSLAGELDWIVMQAIEKDRIRRYQSAREFAEDVQRFLNGEAVEACPPSKRYLLSKFVKRNQGLITLLGVIAASLFSAFAFSLKFAIDANHARMEADQNLVTANDDFRRAMDALDLVINEVGSSDLDQVPGIAAVRSDIGDRAIELYQEVVEEHAEDRGGLLRMAKAQLQMAKLYGLTGQGERQMQHFEASEAILSGLHDQYPDDTQVTQELSQVLAEHALEYEKYYERSGRGQAIERMGKALGLMRQLSEDEQLAIDRESIRETMAESLMHQAMFFQRERKLERAKELLLESIANHPEPDSARQRLLAFNQLHSGNMGEARAGFEKALEIAKRELQATPNDRSVREKYYFAQYHLSTYFNRAGDKVNAEKHAREARTCVLALMADYPNSLWYHKWYVQTFPKVTYEVVQDVARSEAISVQANLIVTLADQDGFRRSAIVILEKMVGELPANERQSFFRALRNATATMSHDGMRHCLNGLLAIWIQDDQAAVEHLRIAFRDDSIRNVLEKSLAHCAPTILQELKTELETEWVNLEPQDLDPWDWREIVKIEFSKGTLDRALKAAENAIKSNEGSAAGWISRGEVHVAMGNYQQAVEDFTEGIKRQGESWVYKRRGEANFLAGDFEQSLADLTRAFELSTGDHSILTWISMERMRECQDTAFRKGMLRLADQVVDSYPNTVKARYNRGQLRSAFGHDVEALDDFAWVVKQRPNDADFRRGLIEFYVIRKRYPEAVSELDQAINDFGDQFLFRYYLGLVTAVVGDEDAYRAACQNMLQASNRGALTSNSVTSHFVAWTAALAPGGLDDYGPAIKLAHEAVESEPDNAQHLGGFGAILFRSGDFEKAKEQLEKALRLPEHANTSTAYSRFFLAMTEDALGNHDQAQQLLQIANKQADAELLDAPPWNRKLTLDLLRCEVEARLAE